MAALQIDYSLLPVDSKAQINAYGGVYNKGVALPLERKMLVASLYRNHQNSAAPNRRPNISKIAAEAKVSEHFVRKVEQELLTYGNVVDPKAVKTDAQPKGVGSRCLSAQDVTVLLSLLESNPFRTRRSYVYELWKETGTLVSESTITNFFLRGNFPFKGNLRKPDLVPKDNVFGVSFGCACDPRGGFAAKILIFCLR